jgi:oligopeptide transport system substrate-binding protein
VPPITGYEQAVPEWAGWSQADREREARRLYREAGYSPEQTLTLELLYNTSANHKRVASAIASMWKQVLGIDVRLLNQEWKVFLATRHSKATTEVFRDGWVGDYNDPFTFAQLMVSNNGMNHPGYRSERYDRLIQQSAGEADPAKRMALMHEAERVLLEDMPILPIYFYVSKHLVKPWVRGWQANIMDHRYTKDLAILEH